MTKLDTASLRGHRGSVLPHVTKSSVSRKTIFSRRRLRRMSSADSVRWLRVVAEGFVPIVNEQIIRVSDLKAEFGCHPISRVRGREGLIKRRRRCGQDG